MAASAGIDGLVLAALAAEGPASGRSVARPAKLRAQVYAALRRLEREGLVSSVPIPHSRRRQRLYRVTHEGIEALATWRLALRSYSSTLVPAPSASARR